MKKTLAVTMFVLVAMILGVSSFAPAMAEPPRFKTTCPDNFRMIDWKTGADPDRNENGKVCLKLIDRDTRVIIDDIPDPVKRKVIKPR